MLRRRSSDAMRCAALSAAGIEVWFDQSELRGDWTPDDSN
jgi:hypothetical protein